MCMFSSFGSFGSIISAVFQRFAVFASSSDCARRRAPCSRSSGVSSAPKSSASNIWRISTSVSSLWGLGQRLTHSIASSFDFTCHSQKPASSSLVSAKGPSITVRLPPENLTRAPLELGCNPSPASITPAFTSSSLYFPISVRSCSLGITPASESLVAFTIIMNRIVVSPSFVNPPRSRRLPCSFVHFPEGERVVLRVLANNEVAHLRHRRFGQADLAAEFLDLCRGFVHRGHSDIVGDRLFRVLACHQSTVTRPVSAAGVDVPVIRHPGKLLDFPAEQRTVKLLRTLNIVRWDFKPDDARRGAASLCVFRCRFCFCAHSSLFVG